MQKAKDNWVMSTVLFFIFLVFLFVILFVFVFLVLVLVFGQGATFTLRRLCAEGQGQIEESQQ